MRINLANKSKAFEYKVPNIAREERKQPQAEIGAWDVSDQNFDNSQSSNLKQPKKIEDVEDDW